MGKFKNLLKEKKEFEITKKIRTKSYLTGFAFAGIIILPFVLLLVNLWIFERYITFIQLGFFFLADMFILLLLTFKDKAYEVYIKELKDFNLRYIRIIKYILITLLLIVIAIFYFTVFRWW